MHAIVSEAIVTPDGVRPGAVLVDGDRIVAVRDRPPPGVPREDLGEIGRAHV